MGYVSDWLHDHNFHREDRVGSKDALKTIWETALLVVLVVLVAMVVMVVIAVIALVSPDTAAIILSYFL